MQVNEQCIAALGLPYLSRLKRDKRASRSTLGRLLRRVMPILKAHSLVVAIEICYLPYMYTDAMCDTVDQ